MQKTLHYIDCINNENNGLNKKKNHSSKIIKNNK